MGTSASATKPRSEPAQLTPSALNIYVLKRGKTAPARERRKVLAAIAEAALLEAVSMRALRCCDGRRYLQHEIGIHEVVERLQEDCEQAEACQEAGECRNDPMRLGLVP